MCVASGCDSPEVWNIETFTKLPSHEDKNVMLNCISEENKCAQPGYGWNPSSVEEKKLFCKNFTKLYSCQPAFSPDEKTSALGTHHGTIELHQHHDQISVPTATTFPVSALSFETEGALIAAQKNGCISVYERNPVDTLSLETALFMAHIIAYHEHIKRPFSIKASGVSPTYYSKLPSFLKRHIAPLLHIKK